MGRLAYMLVANAYAIYFICFERRLRAERVAYRFMAIVYAIGFICILRNTCTCVYGLRSRRRLYLYFEKHLRWWLTFILSALIGLPVTAYALAADVYAIGLKRIFVVLCCRLRLRSAVTQAV